MVIIQIGLFFDHTFTHALAHKTELGFALPNAADAWVHKYVGDRNGKYVIDAPLHPQHIAEVQVTRLCGYAIAREGRIGIVAGAQRIAGRAETKDTDAKRSHVGGSNGITRRIARAACTNAPAQQGIGATLCHCGKGQADC
jgi:hypothetical protein